MNTVQCSNAGNFSDKIPTRRSNVRPKSRRLLRFEGLERRDLLSAYSLWSSSATPQDPADPDSSAVEVGVKFTSDVAGSITGIRFYKGSGNTGTHVGNLWSSTGQKLASATFTGETASGWQQVNFATPVAIQPNTVYVASYHTNRGHYADDPGYFSVGHSNGPLHAPADGASGPNGVGAYGASSTFPTTGWRASNYWVDVVFSTTTADTTPPTVTNESPAPNATGVATTAGVTATFSELVQSGTISFMLKNSSNNVVPATVSYSDTTHTATLTPSAALAGSTTYTATVSGAKDQAGNTMTAPVTWSFTTTTTTTTTTVSVKDFGAKGDGVTDDSAAFNAAIESLAQTGGTVFVPAGVYGLGHPVVIDQNNITLTGKGSSSVLKRLPVFDPNGVISAAAILLPDQPLHNITISHLVFDGDHVQPPGISAASGIWVRQASYVTIDSVIVRNVKGDGIQLANGANADDHVTIENSLIQGIWRNGIHVGDASNTVILGNHIEDTPSQYWQPSAGSGIDVEVEGQDTNGVGPVPGLPFVDNLLIENNVIERQDTTTAGAGVALQPAYGPISNVTIQGNLISNHQNAVYGVGAPGSYGNVSGLDHVTIANNWVDTPTMQVDGEGILLFGGATNLQITGNVIHDQSGVYGKDIELDDINNATVSGNVLLHDVYAWPFYAVYLGGTASNVTLTNNTWVKSDLLQELHRDSGVTNVTDDGGNPIAPLQEDMTPPTISIGIANGTAISSPTPITINATDDTSVARVYFFVDGVPEGFSDTGPYVFTFDPSLYSAGTHVLAALAVDRFANPSTASQVSIQV